MKRFISFLGTGNYQPCIYRIDGKTSPMVVYVQTATNLFANPRCEEAVVFCTQEASAKHWDGLLAEFVRNGLPEPRQVPIPDGATEGQLWEIFRIVRDAVGEGDEVVFDVTHSFRSLPVVATVLLRYLVVAKGVALSSCLYGAWDKRDKETNVAPMFDLTPFFALDDWTHAIRGFELFGDASELKQLSAPRLGPLCRNDETARSLNIAIKNMALFADNVRLANLGAGPEGTSLRAMALRKNISSPLLRKEVADGIPELSPILSRIGRQFSEYGDQDVRNGFRAARWAAAHGLIPQAYTLLQETAVSLVCERFRELVPEGRTGIEVRMFVSDVLASASKNGGDWTCWEPHEDAEAAKCLAERLGKDFLTTFARLVRRRNAINHAGTNVQEPVSSTSPDFVADGFCEIADKIEGTLPTSP